MQECDDGRHLTKLESLGLLDDSLDLLRRHVGLGLGQPLLFDSVLLRRQLAVWQQLHSHLRHPTD